MLGFRAKITDSFWFTPLVMGVTGLLMALGLVYLDRLIIGTGIKVPLSDMGADGSRGILVAIAGSVLGVAATSFSITTSVLATASSTYGPRLVRNFMSDNRNQFVLGSFGASFIYCLMVLRTIRDASDIGPQFVPSLAINFAIILGILNVILLIYFIHHISDSIQISTLISRVRDDLIRSIETIYPIDEKSDSFPDDKESLQPRARFAEALPPDNPYLVMTKADGFVTWIDYNAIVRRATEHDALVKLEVQPGDYVFMGMVVAKVWQRRSTKNVDWPLLSVNNSQTRTPYQDIRYAMQQPVDIAIRALSPGVNDPYTAINAIKGLASGVTRLVVRQNADSVMFDKDSQPRLHTGSMTIEHMLDSVFRTLKGNVAGSVDATMAVLEMAQQTLETTERDSYRHIIINAIRSIDEAFSESSAPSSDKKIITNTADQIMRDHATKVGKTPHEPGLIEQRQDDKD